jgi:hypothetical protein
MDYLYGLLHNQASMSSYVSDELREAAEKISGKIDGAPRQKPRGAD